MQPLLTAQQIREGDAYTIEKEPIASIDLMERASHAFINCFVKHYPDKNKAITIYCGTGNNGGDGLAIACLLNKLKYNVSVKIAYYTDKESADFKMNLKRLKEVDVLISALKPKEDIPTEESPIIIDALLGSGLNKPLAGDYKKLVEYLNSIQKTVVAVDVPTGFFSDGEIPLGTVALKAGLVITFEQPKINFLLPEAAGVIKNWEAINIGIDQSFLKSVDTPYYLVEERDIKQKLKPRKKFSHKGTYGHALLVAGQDKTMGAALLSSAACVYAGAGLTTACIPQSGLTALNAYMPEVMALIRINDKLPDIKWEQYNSIGVGPGLGNDAHSLLLLKNILARYDKPFVVDADSLNLLSENKSLLKSLPKGSILTPHMKEFDRLFGEHDNWWQRLQTSMQKAKELQIIILLKNQYTIIATPEGKLYFNPTGNPAMATGGMGDILTGIITALLAQKYTPIETAILAAYIHGKAGDKLVLPNKLNVVLPSQVAVQLPLTMAKLMA
jgi:NAD(P)H-hydrate epimerase